MTLEIKKQYLLCTALVHRENQAYHWAKPGDTRGKRQKDAW